ncbi:DUF1656 domain-containing protein [Acinetobacter sp. B5B]|uniref:DUF1656 domain-containing protein n=1 Tax=Acinetobacter baretiae TaxID=2605383 RepID=UPI0018C1FE56|nr:DUF1656 domain-containing protein [Acinetobacter baretiae]MBF7682790.1 DUF1656 domain-containing protein [Acinetobacter baretiae]MBF7686306.1 DUF1656 domain-containing protein [Acinetobacter baretiae]
MSDFNLYGVFIPSFLVQAILAYLLFLLVSRCTRVCVERGWIMFVGVFHLCLYVLCLLCVHYIFIWFTVK